MAQYVLINTIGTRRAGEVIDTVQDPGVVPQLAAFGGVLVLLPSPALQPYIEAAQLAYDRADADEAQDIMMAGYASTTAIAGGGTAGFVPIWTAGAVLGDSVIKQSGSLVGINVAAPTAALSLPSGVAGAASLNVASGVAPGAPNSGDLWFDGTYLYLRASGINQPLNAPFGTGTPNVLTKWSSVSGLTDTAITEASGAISTIGITNAGAGATNGTYSQQALTNITGTGTGATADIVVAGNVVTVLALRSPGTGYAPGDTLSCATIGGGGFVFTVSAVSASDNASGNVTALRVGAGTNTPRAALDAGTGGVIAEGADIQVINAWSGVSFLANIAVTTTTGNPAAPATFSTGSIRAYGFYAGRRYSANAAGSSFIFGFAAYPGFESSAAGNTLFANGAAVFPQRSFANDLATNASLSGVIAGASVQSGTGSNASSDLTSFQGQLSNNKATHAITTAHQYDGTFTNAGTITTLTGVRLRPITGAGTVTTFYSARFEATTTQTITNRWAISQEDPLAKSAFYGNFGVGNALDVGAGKVIGSLTLTNAGAGATNGTYSQVALTGGSGTGATADIVVSGNVVTVLTLRNPGQGYAVGDTLSTAAIGGAGFVFTVASTASILRSDGTAVAARIGAGTTASTSAMTVNGMVTLNGAELVSIVQGGTFSNFTVQTPMVLTNGAAPTVMTSNALNYYSAYLSPLLDASALTNNYTVWGVASRPTLVTGVSGATTVSLVGGNFGGQVNAPTMTGKTVAVTGIALFPGVGLLGAGNTISSVTGANLAPGVTATNATPVTVFRETWTRSSFSGAAHTVTDYYAIKMDGPTLSGGATITNRWAIAQDDALAKSRFYGNLGVGNALDVGAGKVIASFTLTNGGTGYTNGTYQQVALTTVTGTGSGATADVVVAGGIVTTVVLRNPGQGYAVSDTLSCASIGAGVNFLLTVATTASILRSDGTVVGTRVGAGTTAPVTTAHVNGALSVTRVEPRALRFAVGTGYCQANVFVDSSGYAADQIPADAANQSQYGVLVVPHYDFSTRATTSLLSAIAVQPFIDVATTAGTTACYGYESYPTVWTTGITGRTISLRAYAGGPTAGALGAGNTLSSFDGVNLTSVLSAANATTVTNARGFNYQLLASGAAHAITSAYGVRLLAASLSGGATITNNWGVSQEDTTSKNQFLGNVGVGVDPLAGKIIGSLTLTAGGTLYTTGNYANVALTGGTGTGATADIVISGGAVTTVVLRAPGQGYVVGDVLSVAAASVGGTGSGFQATVATTASILRSDGTVVGARVGAGTTNPEYTHHVNGVQFLGSGLFGLYPAFGAQSSGVISQLISPTVVAPAGAGSVFSTVYSGFVDCNVGTNTSVRAIQQVSPVVSNVAAGSVVGITGAFFSAYRQSATDLSTAAGTLVYGVNSQAGIVAGVGAASTPTVVVYRAGLFITATPHTIAEFSFFRTDTSTFNAGATITNLYQLRLQPVTGAGTVTNRYPISQEDTLGTNFVRAKTHFGAAVGTAAATTASIEVTAQGTLNGDIRLNSANAVVDVSAASTNGVKFNNRGGAGITSTTQNWYEEGTYTPTLSAGWTATAGNYAGYWTRNGRLVTLTIQFTGGTNSGATGGATISTPVGLTPTRNGAGTAVNANGTALGNGVAVVTTAGTIITANAITTTTVDKTIVVQYEV